MAAGLPDGQGLKRFNPTNGIKSKTNGWPSELTAAWVATWELRLSRGANVLRGYKLREKYGRIILLLSLIPPVSDLPISKATVQRLDVWNNEKGGFAIRKPPMDDAEALNDEDEGL